MKNLLLLPAVLMAMTLSLQAAPPSRDNAQAAFDRLDSLYAQGDFRDAYSCHAEVVSLVRKKAPELLADCLSLSGAVCMRVGAFEDAIKLQEECYGLDLASGDKAAISSSLNNLAATYLAAGDYDAAEEMISRAVDFAREVGDDAALAIRLGMAGDIVLKKGDAAKALEYSTEAWNLDREAGREEKAAVRLSQMGAARIELGQNEKALENIREAVEIFLRTGNSHSLSVCYNQLGILYRNMGNNRLAANYFRMALGLSQKTGNRFVERKIRKELAEVLKATDPNAAVEHLSRYVSLTDSMYTDQSASRLNEFRIKYETAEQQHELELREQQLLTRKISIILLSALLATLLVVTVLLIRSNRLRKKNLEMLKKANELKDRLLALSEMKSQDSGEAIREIAGEISSIGADSPIHLTSREKEVIRYCCEGLLSKEIADRMGISQRTVDTHKTNIFRKLGINTTVELIRYAHKAGIV